MDREEDERRRGDHHPERRLIKGSLDIAYCPRIVSTKINI